jgi:hypothetical protein
MPRPAILLAVPLAAIVAVALAVNLTGVASGTASRQASSPRIVRGHVNLSTGGGQGYTVTHTRTTINGRIHVVYTVTFATHFSTHPVVVAAPEHTCHAFTRENAETTRSGFKANLTGCVQFTFVALESYGA